MKLQPIRRRHFLQTLVAGLGALITGSRPASASSYRVGVGNSSDPYQATIRAIDATSEWPNSGLAGRLVLIKPNLVAPLPAETGATTDPQVVRAVVDISLGSGAAEVLIVEGGLYGANFSACGYDIFESYHPRVRLVDLSTEPGTLKEVAAGLAYRWVYLPQSVIGDELFFISVAKLKTHAVTHATLSLKNLIGLPVTAHYNYPTTLPLAAMHLRGIDQVIVDLALARPVDFALVDGIWAMEGQGPVSGDPVPMDLVFAGRNPIAVDRVCLWAMGLPQQIVRHLTYGVRRGLGPEELSAVDILGDPIEQRAFKWPENLAPLLEYPKAFPVWFDPASGNVPFIVYGLARPCLTRVEIIRTWETSPLIEPIRILSDWGPRPSGANYLAWDGRTDAGEISAQDSYGIWLQAKYSESSRIAYAVGRIRVV